MISSQSQTSSLLRGGGELNFELPLWGGGGGLNRKGPFIFGVINLTANYTYSGPRLTVVK